MATDDRFLHIMQQHPEMIQQVRGHLTPFLCSCFWCVSNHSVFLILLIFVNNTGIDAVYSVEHHHL